jgi:hypothetical protein
VPGGRGRKSISRLKLDAPTGGAAHRAAAANARLPGDSGRAAWKSARGGLRSGRRRKPIARAGKCVYIRPVRPVAGRKETDPWAEQRTLPAEGG